VTLAWDGSSRGVDIDTGLFFTTYFGFWVLGLAMIAIGMVASFLTNNLTVAFILGLLFNSLLVVTYYATTFIPSAAAAEDVARWSFTSRFDDFGRGVLSLSSLAFFGMCIAFGLYMCLILIGKRHWLTHAGETRTNTGVVGGSLATILGLIVIVIARAIFKSASIAARGESNSAAAILTVAFVVGVLLLLLAFFLLGLYRNFSGMLGH
jgi:ABC-2 type transport system permease protein